MSTRLEGRPARFSRSVARAIKQPPPPFPNPFTTATTGIGSCSGTLVASYSSVSTHAAKAITTRRSFGISKVARVRACMMWRRWCNYVDASTADTLAALAASASTSAAASYYNDCTTTIVLLQLYYYNCTTTALRR